MYTAPAWGPQSHISTNALLRARVFASGCRSHHVQRLNVCASCCPDWRSGGNAHTQMASPVGAPGECDTSCCLSGWRLCGNLHIHMASPAGASGEYDPSCFFSGCFYHTLGRVHVCSEISREEVWLGEHSGCRCSTSPTICTHRWVSARKT